MPATARQLVSFAEHLTAEDVSSTRHEYIDGQVVATAGTAAYDRGEWVRRGHGPGSSVPLHSVGIGVDLDALYEGWEPDPDARLPTPPRA
ncbi:MAG: hypothetical protein FJ090_09960 [Deltaproteobacteria bacterium]|nr:hypothetical protein [Deltaproteobacteria bacterium]